MIVNRHKWVIIPPLSVDMNQFDVYVEIITTLYDDVRLLAKMIYLAFSKNKMLSN